jgi:hypothetical protein
VPDKTDFLEILIRVLPGLQIPKRDTPRRDITLLLQVIELVPGDINPL